VKSALSETDCKILSVVNLHADMPLREIQSRTKLKEHQISYSLKKLLESGLITRKILVDVYRLGYTNYGLFFSIHSDNRRTHRQILETLVRSPRISFLAELGGDFQYELTFVAKELIEVSEFLDWLTQKFGNIFFQKSTATRLSLHDFPAKLLFPISGKPPALRWGMTHDRFAIDALDHNILSALSNSQATSTSTVARLLDIPYSTADFRIRRLEERKIIGGYFYLVDNFRIGIQNYLFLIYLKGMSHGLHERMLRFCREHKNIRYLVENLGEWDYEIGVEIRDQRAISDLSREILEIFGSDINTIKTLPIFAYHKVVNFPFDPIEEDGTQ
jgi:Lrp/AsnC family leucine-responsive transcriptional regulator